MLTMLRQRIEAGLPGRVVSMAISGWDPSRDMDTLQQRMNKLFEDSLARGKSTEDQFPAGAWTPAVDIFETAERVVIRADLPGIEQKNIDLRIEENTLILRGERTFAKEENQEDFLRIERSYGSFHRTFRLPSSVDDNSVQATHDHGVLEVTLLKNEDARAKSIKVEVK
jgi:HSP20 family protein